MSLINRGLHLFRLPAVLLLTIFAANANAAPEVQRQGDISFVAGGVGVTEAQEFKALAGKYALEAVFVAKSSPNRYLAAIEVEIKNSKNQTVLKTQVQGPYLLVDLPKGKYTIQAANGKSVKKQSVSVDGGKSRRAVFAWNQEVDV